MLQVIEVVIMFLDGIVRSARRPEVDLRPAGDPRRHEIAQRVRGHGLFEYLPFPGPLRPRTHQRHVASEHVPELRELIYPKAPQDVPETRDSWILIRRDLNEGPILFGAVPHGPEFPQNKRPPEIADSHLPVQRRRTVDRPD